MACAVILVPSSTPLLADEIVVLAPPDRAVIYARVPATHLVARLTDPRDVKALTIETGAETPGPVGVWERGGTYFVHYLLALRPGRNLFVLRPWDREVEVTYRPLRSLLNVDLGAPSVYLFHREETVPAACEQCHGKDAPAPVGVEMAPPLCGQVDPTCPSCHKGLVLQAASRHGPAANWLCPLCHQASEGVAQVAIPRGRIDSLCFRCHTKAKAWKGMPHVHGPVGGGDCTVCHNPHGDGQPFQLWADGRGALCIGCHTEKIRLLETTSRFSIHGIQKGSGCPACHSPHATENRYQLLRPINELCTGCHTGLKGLKRDHPVAGHPVEGPTDPRRKGHRFSCTSCHNPHLSEYKHLLIGDIFGGHVCGKCHYWSTPTGGNN